MNRREIFAVLGGIVGAAFGAKVAAKEASTVSGRFITTGRIDSDDVARYYDLATGEIRGRVTFRGLRGISILPGGDPTKIILYPRAIPLSDIVNSPEHIKKVNDFITGTSFDNVTASTFTGPAGNGVKLEGSGNNISTSLLIFNDGTMELTKQDMGRIPRFNRFKSQRAMDYIISLGYSFQE